MTINPEVIGIILMVAYLVFDGIRTHRLQKKMLKEIETSNKAIPREQQRIEDIAWVHKFLITHSLYRFDIHLDDGKSYTRTAVDRLDVDGMFDALIKNDLHDFKRNIERDNGPVDEWVAKIRDLGKVHFKNKTS